MLDGTSRLVLSYMILDKKEGASATTLFAQAAAHAVHLPLVLVSDGLLSFITPSAKKIFTKMNNNQFVHIREIHLQNYNNVYE